MQLPLHVFCFIALFVSAHSFPLSQLETRFGKFTDGIDDASYYDDATTLIRISFSAYYRDLKLHPDVQVPDNTAQAHRLTQVVARVNRLTDDVLWAHVLIDILYYPVLTLDKTGTLYIMSEYRSDEIVIKRISRDGLIEWSRLWQARSWLGLVISNVPLAISADHHSLLFVTALTTDAANPKYATDSPYVIPIWKNSGLWATPMRMISANDSHTDWIDKFSQSGRIACVTTSQYLTPTSSRTALGCATYKGQREGRLLNLGEVHGDFDNVEVVVETKVPGRLQAVYTLRRQYIEQPNNETHDELDLMRRNVNTLRPYRWKAGSWSSRRIRLPLYEFTYGAKIIGIRYVEQSHSVAVLLETRYNTTGQLLAIRGGYRLKWARIQDTLKGRFYYWMLQFDRQWKPRIAQVDPTVTVRQVLGTDPLNKILNFKISPDGRSFSAILQLHYNTAHPRTFANMVYEAPLPIIPEML